MPLSLRLRLDERHEDRVSVSVLLEPDGDTRIEGVALEMQCPMRTALSPRVLLPVSGVLSGPLMTTAEIRSEVRIPQGAIIVGTVWAGDEQISVSMPTDPCTGLEGHVRGCPSVGRIIDDRHLTELSEAQVLVLRRALPWIGEPSESETNEPYEVTDDEMDHLCADLGLDDECAQWLKDLMAEDC